MATPYLLKMATAASCWISVMRDSSFVAEAVSLLICFSDSAGSACFDWKAGCVDGFVLAVVNLALSLDSAVAVEEEEEPPSVGDGREVGAPAETEMEIAVGVEGTAMELAVVAAAVAVE